MAKGHELIQHLLKSATLPPVYYILLNIIPVMITSVGRIGDGDVRKAISVLQASELQCYVCGPPPMLDSMVEILTSERCRVERDRIHFEKWW